MSQLTTIEQINTFTFAGNATLTLRSKKTGDRFTYRVRMADSGNVWFVSVLTGSDNEGDFEYLGFFKAGGEYIYGGRKARIGSDAPSAIAFAFFAGQLARPTLHPMLEVYHEGRCGACNHKLTTPESIMTGFGPECSDRLGIPRFSCEGIPTVAEFLAA